ncbi:MAG: pyridoxal kinase [Rhodospirillaceae bacterium]
MTEAKSVLSIHSHVARGHVGNSAAVLPLQRLGHEVWAVPSVVLAHHLGRGGWRGRRLGADAVAEVLAGIEADGGFAELAAVHTGYLGDIGVGEAALAAWARIAAARPDALICCDPILGDEDEGLYVEAALVDFYRDRALPAAHVIFPNRFELATLSGEAVEAPASAVRAARRLIAQGPKIVVATSVPAGDGLASLLVTADAAWQAVVPRRPLAAKGAGDVFAALWLGHYLNGGDAAAALGRAAGAADALIREAVRTGAPELPLVGAQAQWTDPAAWIDVLPLNL